MAGPHKIKKISAADQVYDEMRRLILDEVWKAGEKIPTETQLASQFEVNRLTVRVALQRLQALGLLDIRVGDGTYVKEFNLTDNISELSVFYSEQTPPQTAREYRYIIETSCLRLAIDRRTEEDLSLYWDQYLKMAEHAKNCLRTDDAVQSDKAALTHTDMSLEIHSIICRMAHNELLNYAFSIAKGPNRQLMLRNVMRRMKTEEDTREVLANYEKLYHTLRERKLNESLELLEQIMDIHNPADQISNFG